MAQSHNEPDILEDDRVTPSARRPVSPLSPLSKAGPRIQSTQDLAAIPSSSTYSSEHAREVTSSAESSTVTATPATENADVGHGYNAGTTQIPRRPVLTGNEVTREDETRYPTIWVAATTTIAICFVSFAHTVDSTIIGQ